MFLPSHETPWGPKVSEMGSFSRFFFLLRPWLGGKCHARWRPVGGWSLGVLVYHFLNNWKKYETNGDKILRNESLKLCKHNEILIKKHASPNLSQLGILGNLLVILETSFEFSPLKRWNPIWDGSNVKPRQIVAPNLGR